MNEKGVEVMRRRWQAQREHSEKIFVEVLELEHRLSTSREIEFRLFREFVDARNIFEKQKMGFESSQNVG